MNLPPCAAILRPSLGSNYRLFVILYSDFVGFGILLAGCLYTHKRYCLRVWDRAKL